jgi:hypothetical protein
LFLNIGQWRPTGTPPPAPSAKMEVLMGKRSIETEDQRKGRLEKAAQKRTSDAAEDQAVDAMVKKSLKLHGP